MANSDQISGIFLARNSLLNLVGKITPLSIGVITIPFIIRGLGAERFGLLSLAWVTLSYFSIFDLGLGRATTKFVAEALGKNEIKKIPSLVVSAVTAQAIFGIAGSLFLWGITPLLIGHVLNIPGSLLNEAKNTFYILAFSIPVVSISSSFMGVLAASQRFDLLNLVMIPSTSFTFILSLVGVLLNIGLPGIIVLILCSKAIALFAYLIFSLKIIHFFKGNIAPTKKMLKKLLSFGGWVVISSIISPMLVYIDRFFIGSLLTLSAVGYYTGASEIIMRLSIIPSSLVMTLFPAFSFIGDTNKERLGLLYMRAVKYLLLGVGPIIILIVLFAKVILRIWLGSEFAMQGVLVLQILALGVLINSLARVPSGLLQGLGRPDITAKFHLLELPLYIAMVWFLTGKMGIIGAAAAWTLRVSFDAGLLFIACSVLKIVPTKILVKNGVKRNLTIFAGIILTFSIIFIIGEDLTTQAVFGIFLIAFFIFMTWHYALESTEKKIIGSIIYHITITKRQK